MKYINQEDWETFQAKFKDAAYFLQRRQLLNERRHLLTNEYILNDWQKKRLAELERWHEDMTIIGELV